MWVKLDDRFPDHPRVIGLTDSAFRGYVEGLCYAARHLTDGYLPSGFTRLRKDVLDELVGAGLWTPASGERHRIRDFTDYNPPAATVRERQVDRAEAKRRGGQARAAQAARNPDGTYRGAPAAAEVLDQQPAEVLARGRASHRRSQPAEPAPGPAASQVPSSPVPVPVPDASSTENLAPGASTGTRPNLRVDDRAMYLLSRLTKHDERWAVLTPGALVKLGKEFGMEPVVTALGFCREDLPEGVRSPYAYLRTVVQQLIRDRQGGA